MATRRQTRLANVNNVALNSKKVHFVDNVRVSLTKCDAMNLKSKLKKKVSNIIHSNNTRATRNSSRINVNGASSKTSSPRKRKSLSPKKIAPPSPSKARSPTKTNPRSKPSQNSPKKRKLDNDSSPTKLSKTPTGAEEARPKSPVKLKSPTKNATKAKGNKLKAQMKLGRIFVKPNFPVKSILKKNINAEDKQEKQGQSTIAEKEANNNVVKRLQPKILLRKIDHRNQRNVSPVRHVHETRRTLRSNR